MRREGRGKEKEETGERFFLSHIFRLVKVLRQQATSDKRKLKREFERGSESASACLFFTAALLAVTSRCIK